MFKPFAYALAVLAFVSVSSLQAEQTEAKATSARSGSSFKSFTGKVLGNNVRMRTSPDLDSHIVSELLKDDYVVVTAEKGEFYAVEPPSEMKAYIFRGFVIDDVVEGDRVNVRLAPDRDAPIVGHHSTGDKIAGKICDDHPKWLEINVPAATRFYVSKEYIEYAGKPEMKVVHDKRKDAVKQLFEATELLTQKEMLKPFNEIDSDRIVHNLQTIINDYADFSTYVDQSTKALAQFQEDYLHRKIAYLEAKASKLDHGSGKHETYEIANKSTHEYVSPTDRMKIWEPVEEALYLSWSAMHHAKTMDDFYQDQKLKGQTISGILEAYKDPIKSRPGDYILKERDVPVGYVYSTHVNLEDLVGKRVNLIVSPRENNNFAFPAYYVLDAE
jgi:hypothetical protein